MNASNVFRRAMICLTILFSHHAAARLEAQFLEKVLLSESTEKLAKDALALGDARRGAIVFYQPYMACTKCHAAGKDQLGPELSKLGKSIKPEQLVDAVLRPSKTVLKGFETVTVRTDDGKTFTGLLVKDEPGRLLLRDPNQNGKILAIKKDNIEARKNGGASIMPAGLANQLTARQQFLDLIRYLNEVVQQGPRRALELRPDPSLYAARPLPEYEKNIDHAGMISSLDGAAFKRGAAIYNRLCINCHGSKDRPGSLPTSLRFAEGKFKSGSDPYTMYQTLTKGFGMMVPQTWMVPQQKYDVIHYVREAYLKPYNATQYFPLADGYLAKLPKGTTRGPAAKNIELWANMDYGPSLVNTYEVGRDASNFAYKGIAVRLDAGPGGVSRGRHWMVFDHDTMRVAAVWSGEGFIDWNGIHFNGRHGIHPRLVGNVHYQNPTGPGWANPDDESFADPRLKGRDGRLYGPLPRKWAHYKGMYYHENRVVISYTVADTDLLEMPGMVEADGVPVFTRSFRIGPRRKDLVLRVVDRRRPSGHASKTLKTATGSSTYQLFGAVSAKPIVDQTGGDEFRDGRQMTIAGSQSFKMSNSDYSIVARIKTTQGGTIFCKGPAGKIWKPDGKTLFVRDGRLCFDIGWVGQVTSRQRVGDGKFHDVAMSYDGKSGLVRLYVDGKLGGEKVLKPKGPASRHVARLGYTSSNFPQRSFFQGRISRVRFYKRLLTSAEMANGIEAKKGLLADWDLAKAKRGIVADGSGQGHRGTFAAGKQVQAEGHVVASAVGNTKGFRWSASKDGKLLLRIPRGETPIEFTLWTASAAKAADAEPIAATANRLVEVTPLLPLTKGGPPRWPQELETRVLFGSSGGPFEVDVLSHPRENPWFCRARLTGFDFYDDGDRAAVCSWDGGVWLVTGLKNAEGKLRWRRIASGLFQPLGLKLIEGKIYVACRDQITILHDLNGDLEIDYFQNFNNDHQVTDHFHEFAMGLQRDDKGNLYYAKSARHALTALVPHHGTLLRVSPDGSRTDILANGFRAANGVCINPDGTFIVTDQEGHWNPKNRINWVKEGGFYGNMFGYHNVTDTSDSAMQQPLCWITNSFDRSPAELLWVKSDRWGPLNGSLLNLSYGYGKVYVVPHEKIKGQVQGGMCQLPIPRFPTGVMRGRFHPVDGQLYTCGMFAWAGNQQQPGGFYRIRYTGKPVHLPKKLEAKSGGIRIRFSGALDRSEATNPENYAIKVWSLKRTANYGSRHYDERPLKVTGAELSADGRSLFLKVPQIAPTWCMEIRYALKGSKGESVNGVVHNTIHNLGKIESP